MSDAPKREWLRRVLAAGAPRSVVPEAPAQLTPQGQTMTQAASSGALFCEPCARATAAPAAELAHV